MKLSDINKLTDEEYKELTDALDPYSFENYCGSCFNFNTEDCPFINKVFPDTDWKHEIKCDKFFS